MPFERPSSLKVALNLLSQGFLPLAGGTDYYPGKVGKPINEPLVDVTGIAALKRFEAANGHLTLGALTTWRECIDYCARPESAKVLLALSQASREVGGWQIQNRGTLGGNLCNASPAADGVVALLALDSEVSLVSHRSSEGSDELVRTLALEHFVLGNRQTAIGQDELLLALKIPLLSSKARSVFLKLGHRRYLVISIAMVAVVIDFDQNDRVNHCRIAVGACSKAALRIKSLEAKLLGLARGQVVSGARDHVGLVADVITPINDVRGSAEYRFDAVQTLIVRALEQAVAL
jgi:CO/xanthine dehydrogenase FAD-binding subunit